MNELTTYDERSQVQRREAISAGAQRITELQRKIDEIKREVEGAFVTVVNAMREQGVELMRMADREQLTFGFFAQIEGELPFDYETAKKRVSLAKMLPKPIKTLNEAREVYTNVLYQAELLEEKRGEANRGVSHDPFSIALNSFVLIKQKFMKAMMVMPLENCAKDRLKTIVAETQWARDLNEQARAALGT